MNVGLVDSRSSISANLVCRLSWSSQLVKQSSSHYQESGRTKQTQNAQRSQMSFFVDRHNACAIVFLLRFRIGVKARRWSEGQQIFGRVFDDCRIIFLRLCHQSPQQAVAVDEQRAKVHQTLQSQPFRLPRHHKQVSGSSLHYLYIMWLMFLSFRTVSAIQSLLSVIFGFVVCNYSCRRNFLTTSHILSESYAW